jgi:hypothetical protein
MKVDKAINNIIHEVNIAHSIDCNKQARYHIQKQCTIMRNKVEKKWNELGIWLLNNPDATVVEIQIVREKLNIGDSVRGFKIGKDKLINSSLTLSKIK